MKLITGVQEQDHIEPKHDAFWHRGVLATDTCVLPAGKQFETTILANNAIQIADGVGMIQGRFFCVEPGTTDTVSIAAGNQGEKRLDVIAAKITVDNLAGTQSASWEVIRGTAGSSYTMPEIPETNLDNGDTEAYMLLCYVYVDGVSVTFVRPWFETNVFPLKNGGTGTDLTLHGMPNGILRINEDGTGMKTMSVFRGVLVSEKDGDALWLPTLPVEFGGTDAMTPSGARTNLGLGNVENKSSATIRGEITADNVRNAVAGNPALVKQALSLGNVENKNSATIRGELTAANVNGAVAQNTALIKQTLGLGNVENKNSATIRSEITADNVKTALGGIKKVTFVETADFYDNYKQEIAANSSYYIPNLGLCVINVQIKLTFDGELSFAAGEELVIGQLKDAATFPPMRTACSVNIQSTNSRRYMANIINEGIIYLRANTAWAPAKDSIHYFSLNCVYFV